MKLRRIVLLVVVLMSLFAVAGAQGKDPLVGAWYRTDGGYENQDFSVVHSAKFYRLIIEPAVQGAYPYVVREYRYKEKDRVILDVRKVEAIYAWFCPSYDQSTKYKEWRQNAYSQGPGRMSKMRNGGTLYVVRDDGTLVKLDSSGRLLETFYREGPDSMPAFKKIQQQRLLRMVGKEDKSGIESTIVKMTFLDDPRAEALPQLTPGKKAR